MRSKPRCYGMAVTVSALSAVCRACESRSGCIYEASLACDTLPDGPAAQRVRQHLSLVSAALLGSPPRAGQGDPKPAVTASTRGVLRVNLSERQLAYLKTLPAKVAGPVETLMRRGWFAFAKAELLAGRLPGGKGWKLLLCQCMLEKTTREDFESRLQAELKLTAASAKTQASLAISIFRAGGLLSSRSQNLTVIRD